MDTDSSGGMAAASPQDPPPYFDRQSIGNPVAADRVGSPGRVEELDRRSGEEGCGWERRVRDLEEEVHRLRCKEEDDRGHHEYGSRIYLRADVVINGVKVFE